jgi:ethanolamine utilization protein EutQ (cupin superfamily)
MMSKQPPRLFRFNDLKFDPVPDIKGTFAVAEICNAALGSELGTGFARFTNVRFSWTTSYDEVITVLEGEMRLHIGGEVFVLGPRDTMWIPSGTSLDYEASDALTHYAIHPSNWQEAQAGG